MNNIPEPHDRDYQKSKSLDINDLMPTKVMVTTSIGNLYVRSIYTGDFKHFGDEDPYELGKAVVQHSTSHIEDKKDRSPLSEEDFISLNDSDFSALASVIANKNSWSTTLPCTNLIDIGNAIKADKATQIELHQKFLNDIRKSIGLNYDFLDKGPLKKLQDQMTGLVNLRKEATSSLVKPYDPFHLRTAFPLDPKITLPPRPEETRLGRATIESAENSRETMLRMNSLVEIVAGVNQTLVSEILPAWSKKFEKDQKDAETAFINANKSLLWTKRAVILSVLVTMLATWWQILVAREIDKENTLQQNRIEMVLREQLATQQKFIEQQANDSASMRAALSAFKPLAPTVSSKK